MTNELKIWLKGFRWMTIPLFCAYFLLQFNTLQPYLLSIFILVVLASGFRQYWDRTLSALAIFIVIYWMIRLLNGYKASPVIWFNNFFAPFALYVYAKSLIRDCGFGKDFRFFILIVLISACVNYIILSVRMYISGSFLEMDRMLDWGNTSEDFSEIGATLIACYVAPGLAGLSTFLSAKKKVDLLPLLFLAISLLSLFVNINLINRSAIVVIAILAFFSFTYNSTGENNRKFLFAFILLAAVVALIFKATDDVASIVETYKLRNEKDTSGAGGRFAIWITAITRLFTNPLGWSNVPGFSHNLWLDIARYAGIVPFIVFIVVTIRALKPAIHLYRVKNNETVALVLGLNIVMFLYAFVEPLICIEISYFFLFFVWGLTKELSDRLYDEYE